MNSVFSLFAVTGNTIALRVMLTFNCLLLLVVVSTWCLVLILTDGECLNEDMYVPKYHECYVTCEDYLNDKKCLKKYLLNDEKTCYCKSPKWPNVKVLTLDGRCVLMEECTSFTNLENLPLIDTNNIIRYLGILIKSFTLCLR